MTSQASLLEELDSVLTDGSHSQRVKALSGVAELFLTGSGRYTEEQIELFDEVIGRLAAAIGTKARARLADTLTVASDAPHRVTRSLAFDDDIDVAGSILTRSRRMTDEDLLDNARTKSQQHLLAISQRPSLTEAVTDVLVTRGNQLVVHTVAKNPGARFSEAGFRMLVRRSNGDDQLAGDVGVRPDLPQHHLVALLEGASAAVRRQLVALNPKAAEAIDKVVAEIADTLQSEVRNASPKFTAAQAHVQAIYRAGNLGEAEIRAFAQDRKFEETAVALALMCRVPVDVVERALLERSHEITLVIAKVAGLTSTTAKALLLLRAADRGISAQDLEQALKMFSRLQYETASRVLRARRQRAADVAVSA